MNFALAEAGYPVVSIMPDKASRNEYMETLAKSRETGDLRPFEVLVAKYCLRALRPRIEILKANERSLEQARNEINLPPEFFDR